MEDISAVIVDDESLVLEKLRRFLEEAGGFNIRAECANGREAMRAISEHRPAVVFLDIEMPEINGFELIENIAERENIYWIFVTAYDRYAVKAFEVEAGDYLLKPFDKKRFLKTVSRIRSHLHVPPESNGQSQEQPLEKLLVKEHEQIKLIDCRDIIYIESKGNYILIHTRENHYTIRYALRDIAQKLHPRKFFRIHRSMIINIDSVVSMEPWFAGDYKVVMENGEELKMSRNYKSLLNTFQ